MLDTAGFDAQVTERWRIALEFESWVTRMRTPTERVTTIRSMWQSAPDEVRQYFGVKDDCSFELDAIMIEAKARGQSGGTRKETGKENGVVPEGHDAARHQPVLRSPAAIPLMVR